MTTENKILIEQGRYGWCFWWLKITLSLYLTIIQSRHPLQELNIDVFIPNDAQIFGGRGISMEPEASTTNSTESDHSEDPVTREASESRQSLSQHSRSVTSSTFQNEYSVWLLSGANFSGKSVYIRQVCRNITGLWIVNDGLLTGLYKIGGDYHIHGTCGQV